MASTNGQQFIQVQNTNVIAGRLYFFSQNTINLSGAVGASLAVTTGEILTDGNTVAAVSTALTTTPSNTLSIARANVDGGNFTPGSGSGSATVFLTSNYAFSGGVTVNANSFLGIGRSATGASGSLAANVGLAAATSTLSLESNQIFSGNVTGSGQLRMNGAGSTAILTGSASHTGGTVVSAGTLQIGNAGTTGEVTENISVGTGATVAFNRSDAVTYGKVISGAGTLSLVGPQLTLTGANTIATTNVANATTLTIGNGTTAGSLSGNIVNNGTVRFDRTDPVTFGGAGSSMSGDGILVKENSNVLTLASTNTHTGGTQIDNGTLVLGATNALGSGSLIFNGGTLSTGATTGFSQTLGLLDISADAVINLGTGSHTLTFTGALNPEDDDTLIINGWNGDSGGRIVFTSQPAFDAAYLASIQFTGYELGATYRNLGGGQFELVPVPEPTTVLGIATLGLAGVSYIRRRRTAQVVG